jgi:diguanylate cyclase (GGDEF)-like protein
VNSLTSADTTLPFITIYRQALLEYVLTGEGEEALMCAYELGRRAITEQRNILDLVTMHQDSIWSVILEGNAAGQMNVYLRRSEQFLSEVMAPFEMMHRGFVDTIQQLQKTNATLEQRVDERTRDLQESERHTADLARLYQILSSINSTIVRLQDREELFKEVCRISVDQGGYPLAWITMRNTAGLDSADIRCQRGDDGLSSCQPTPIKSLCIEIAVAIDKVYAEGKPVILYRPGDNPASRNGPTMAYAAYGLLPLALDGVVVGVFALFSNDPEAFAPAEMRLLTEMAGDLSFALEHIHKGEQLTYLAYHDILTGLPNRSLLLERLPVQLQAAEQAGTIVALLMIDLDRFSDVTNTYGRHVGDSLLKQIGTRFCEITDNCGTVARLGANRFALSLANINKTDQVAHILEQQILSNLARPFRVGDEDIHITVHIGISLFPFDADNADILYKNAEIALKRAQSKGEAYLLYDAAMNSRIIHSVTMEAKLRNAVALGRLTVDYQPKVAAADGRIVGLEALLRYIDPDTGSVPPSDFIHLLEETALITVIGGWVMQHVVDDLRHWQEMQLDPPRVAVNVSPVQLRQRGFVTSLRQLLADSGGHSNGLDIEITESAVMEEVEKNIPKLEALREMGFHIAIDDFGTGYSSLSYLSRLPVNALKIDRSFIVEMTERPNSLAIVTSIISLAHSLDLEVIAEGVEFEEQAKLLRLLRCEVIQGNLYSPPLPAQEIVALLRRGRL